MGTGHPPASRRPLNQAVGFAQPDRTIPADRSEHETYAAHPVDGRGLHTIVLTDMAASARRDNQSQRRMRSELYAMMHDLVRYLGLDLDALALTDTGDGIRLLMPVRIVEPMHVIDAFVVGLAARLREHRRHVNEVARVRLRVALDLGVVERHHNGWSGEPLVRASRLVDADPVRAALDADDRLDFAVILSDVLFQTVVLPGQGFVGPSSFDPVTIAVKEFRQFAWQLRQGTGEPCRQCGRAAA
ncbi:hypothetical protein Val02_12260 [Virgisporangium aliadipatigenens]|uniref:Guanylate cyclase domain-containing protein n=1 Tax=Virgisporangium aliadipatigenens TaxID=741659 RepID=A0A8J3YI10_9ACTN|nr:hypothetical protein [Virgisporangium aliadipatigenens]GIJ44340.1 hypothetical protein Val02_12260 [Virgisporangium aliadipatigenens]